MNEELRELYQEVILDHNSSPRNFRRLDSATHTCEGYNPLCGDRINIFVKISDNKIEDIAFQGSGCAISKASASVMTTEVKGKTIAQARELFQRFQRLIKGETAEDDGLEHSKLAIFAGVREFPSRVKCAALAWHTLLSAIEQKKDIVTTE
ncbi:MAG: SUF system NifU family Fe-S cluster assembly protein [Calditrichaeota bacterium]|nr:MAG: SUF system NifU family Fe-S cluster assembly protein [Calditrichota bacterium]